MRQIISISFLLLCAWATQAQSVIVSSTAAALDTAYLASGDTLVIVAGRDTFRVPGVGGGGGSLPSGYNNAILTYNSGAWAADSTPVVGSLVVNNALTVNPTDQDLITAIGTWNYGVGNGHTYESERIIDKTGGVAYGAYDASDIIRNHSYDHYTSHQARPTAEATASLTTLYGFNNIPTINGTVTNNFGFYAQDYGGTGTVTNNIGIKIPRLLNGVNKWALMLDSVLQATADGAIRFCAYGVGAHVISSPAYVYATNIWGDLKEITPTNLVRGVTGYNLVKGVGLANRLPYWVTTDSQSYAPSMYVDAVNTRLGLGYTSSPTSMLSLFSSSANGVMVETNNNAYYQLYSYNSSPNNKVSFYAAQGTKASPTILTASKYLGIIDFYGYDGASMLNAGGILMQVDGTPASGSMPTKLIFQTRQSGFGGASDRGAISNKGYWGFGTTTPGYWMDINASTNAATAILKIKNSADSSRVFCYSVNPNSVISGKPGDLLCYPNATTAGLFGKITGSGTTTGWGKYLNELDANGASTNYAYLWSGTQWTPGFVDLLATNEGSLTVTAATSNSANIHSNTSGSTDVEIGGDANTLVTENTGTGDITISANQPVVITLSPILFTDSLKTTGTLTKDYFPIPAAYNGWTVKSVVWGVRYAGSGSGSLVVGFDIYNNASPRAGTFANVLAGSFSATDVEKVVAGGGQTVLTGQLWVPRISTDTIVTHPVGLTCTVVLQPQ